MLFVVIYLARSLIYVPLSVLNLCATVQLSVRRPALALKYGFRPHRQASNLGERERKQERVSVL